MEFEADKLTDEELIRLSRDGQRDAVDVLLERYKPLVLRLTRSKFLVGGEKEDLIQEGMIGLYKAVRDYEEDHDATFFTFAALCINRQMSKAIASSLSNKNQPLNEYVSLTDEEWETEYRNGWSGNPEKILIDKEWSDEMLARVRDSLSDMEKNVLDLSMSGFDYKEIAKIMKKDPKAIDNAIQRIRRKSREL